MVTTSSSHGAVSGRDVIHPSTAASTSMSSRNYPSSSSPGAAASFSRAPGTSNNLSTSSKMGSAMTSNGRAGAGSTSIGPSRFLVTVIPPEHIPHDPPHPRTSTLCSGYGPPAKFRRGTLIPLYPTLSGQIGAIAREYGLPSTGGLVLYLVELNQEGPTSPLNEALLGGPRIGNEAWQLLWGQLFEEEQKNNSSLVYSEEDDEGESTDAMEMSEGASRPQPHASSSSSSTLLSGLPASSRPGAEYERRAPSEALSDVSSLADTSSAPTSEDMSAQQNLSQFSASSGASPFSATARRFAKSSTTTSNTTVDNNSYSSSSSPQLKGKARASRHQAGSRSTNLRNQPSRASLGTNRSYANSAASSSSLRREGNVGPIYGESVIVGKLEWDIDSKRGGGRWFDAWLQSAETSSSSVSPPIGTPASQSSRGFSTGGNGHPESQFGTLLKSRRPSNQGASLLTREVYQPPPRSIASEDDRSDGQPDPFARQASPTVAVRSSSSGAHHAQPVQAPSNRSLPPEIKSSNSISAGSTLSQQQQQQQTASRSLPHDDNRHSIASSISIDRQSSKGKYQQSRPPSEQSLRSAYSETMRSTAAAPGTDELSRRSPSPRSSTGSLGQSAAYLEALNATPRVRGGSQTFRARSPSPTPSIESAVQEEPRTNRMSELSSTSAAEPTDEEREEQTDRALPEQQQRRSVASSSARSRQRVASTASGRSAASSASFEAVSDDQDEQDAQDDHIGHGEYQALGDEDEDNYGVDAHAIEEPEARARALSPSESSEYGNPTEASEKALSPPASNRQDAMLRDPLRDIFPSDAATWADLRSTDMAEDPDTNAASARTEDDHESQERGQDFSEALSPAGTTAATGLGIEDPSPLPSPYLPIHHAATLPQSISTATGFDPFEFDSDLGPSSPLPKGEDRDGDLEEVVDLLRAHSQAKDQGLSSPINLGDPAQMPSPPQMVEDDEESEREREPAGTPAEQRHSEPLGRTASPASSYSKATHSKADSTSSIPSPQQHSLHSRQSSSISSVHAAAAAVTLPQSESERSLSTIPAFESSNSIATSASSHPSIAFPMPPRGGNRGAGIPMNWASELSNTYGNIRTRTNSDVTDGETAAEAGRNQNDRPEQLAIMPVGESPRFLTEGAGGSKRNSVASLKKAEMTRSRSSSVEMMDNLDEIERVLQELSPRSMKDSTRTRLSPMPDFGPFFPAAAGADAAVATERSVATTPGYQGHSDLEAEAPNTPVSATTAHPSAEVGEEEPEEAPRMAETTMEKTIVLAAPPRGASLHASAVAKAQQDEVKPQQQQQDSETASPPPALPLKVRNKENSTPLSPGAMSVASTTLPYDFPSPTSPAPPLPQTQPQTQTQQVTFAEAPDTSRLKQSLDSQSSRTTTTTTEEDQPSSAKSTSSSKFGGLRMKGWSGKSSKGEKDGNTLQLGNTPGLNAVASEQVKSPLGSFKGFRFWQKEEPSGTAEATQKLASETSLPMSPANSQQQNGDTSFTSLSSLSSSKLPAPQDPPRTLGRIPRKSSLASLKNAMTRSDSHSSPSSAAAASGLGPAPQMASPHPTPAAANSPFSNSQQTYPSPPTHTSLPSPSVTSGAADRSAELYSFMPSYPPPFAPSDDVDEDDNEALDAPPMMFRNGSGSPRFYPQGSSNSGSGIQPSTSTSSFSNSRYQRAGDGSSPIPPALDSTPEMGPLSGGRFLGQEGRSEGGHHQISSAPVTPAYAEPSVISSSGRFGKPIKANPARSQFRLSADADLTKMLSHMQAIEFGEDESPAESRPSSSTNAAQSPAVSSLKGLGLGLSGARKNST